MSSRIRTGLRPCATLHRVFPTDNTLPDGDLRQFLQYQCVSNTMKGVWSDAVTQPHISRLMVALSQQHKAVAEQGEATVIPASLMCRQITVAETDCNERFNAERLRQRMRYL